jgi:hypothetical protein
MSTNPLVAEPLAGIDERWASPEGVRAATRIRDMWWDGRAAWGSAGGYRRIIRGPLGELGVPTNPFAAVGAVESVHWFSQHNGARSWLIYVALGSVVVFNPSTAARAASPGDAAYDRGGNALTRAIVETPWQRSQSFCWGDNFYLLNGIDRAIVFNGTWWDYAGFPGPAGTPSAVVLGAPHACDLGPGTGAGDQAQKMPNTGLGPTIEVVDTDYKCGYRYRVAYVNSRGQVSPLSPPSELVSFTNPGGFTVSTGAHFVKLTLPIGGSEVVARRIFRTQNINDSAGLPVIGRADQYFYWGDIPDNCTSALIDGKTDSMLASQVIDPSAYGPWPSNARFATPFKGCLFAAGTNSSSLYFSAPNNPEVFPLDNVLAIPDSALGPITAMYATRNALVVFKADGVYLVKGDPVNGFFCETLTLSAGCVAPNTVREVPGAGLVFLGKAAVHCLQGTLENEGVPTQVINLSVPLPSVMRRLNRSALINACAAVYHRDKEYWLAVPTIGKADNDLVLVFHWEVRAWSTREKYPIASMLETSNAAGQLLFASYASTTARSPDGLVHLGVMVYSRGWPDKDGTAIEPLYETGQYAPGGTLRAHRPKGVLVHAILHGNNRITCNLRANRSRSFWFPVAKSEPQQLPQELVPLYGAARFDAGSLWQQLRPGPIRIDMEKNIGNTPILESAITLTPATGTRHMTIMGVALELPPDDPSLKPLRASATSG